MALSIAVPLLALTALGLGCRSPDQIYREYASRAEAAAAGEVERGWLPDWTPPAAQHIQLQGDIDTNEWWLRYDLDSGEAEVLKAQLARVSPTRVRVSKPSQADWWFEGLIEQQPANGGALYAEVYRGTGAPVPGSTLVAFDRHSQAVYVWPNRPAGAP